MRSQGVDAEPCANGVDVEDALEVAAFRIQEIGGLNLAELSIGTPSHIVENGFAMSQTGSMSRPGGSLDWDSNLEIVHVAA